MTYELRLTGCAPTPLAHYLKGLGVLRLVAEQADPGVLGFWKEGCLSLLSTLDRQALTVFFLDAYRPTPLYAPWNGGSGFFPKDGKSARALQRILDSRGGRFSVYRAQLIQARELVASMGLGEPPRLEAKTALFNALRGQLPDSALDWLDAVILLTEEGLRFPPLLGSGGNDGRLEFTSNFMERLLTLVDPDTDRAREAGRRLLPEALFAEPAFGLGTDAIGQFLPGGVGGPNATAGFEADSLSNPWDYVLMLEGALLFAAAATRRLGAEDATALSYPFTVRATGAGHGGLGLNDEHTARAEMWLPLWRRPASYPELRMLLEEGRITLGRRLARDGLDAARALHSLGMDRGIGAFQRYTFLQRSGKAYLAMPLDRVRVRSNPRAKLISDLDRRGWLGRVRRTARRDETPARFKDQVVRLENALFTVTRRPGPEPLQAVLTALGQLQRYLATSPDLQEAIPPQPLLGRGWALDADDGSHEYRLAAALAGLSSDGLPMRVHLAPVEPSGKAWAPGRRLAVWGAGPLTGNLLRVLERRLLEAERQGLRTKPLHGQPGADLAAIAAFLGNSVNEARVAALLAGLAFVQLPGYLPRRKADAAGIPGAYAFLKPLFVPEAALHGLQRLPADARLPLPPALVAQLRADQVDKALVTAWRRLHASGMAVPYPPPDRAALPGPRLGAALMIPVTPAALRELCSRAYPGNTGVDNPPQMQESPS